MRIKSVIAAVFAASIALSATPASADNTHSNSVTKERQAEQKKICKWLPVTGSNRQERHCLTKEDWKKAEALFSW
jgi:hypothetical protein